ncbi:ankyrin repeat and SOCS box protein 16 isoform X1 [Brienomyrus brachyistius]|uniref:ankyrin repeat and SOCS box protein 16 isoform X1 n=2 Tax=Brienomyrus brachyistius TaxID=42636 RepID=UPI0020B23307|nr:ankyrin repeat and SOCS box protein 16 isoform X1 [Brienomyrus brachyistius]XP_048859080.1 ankyrin repeat and SOCS box protein 16 isoform X1 [Brienomyrus brachyistius]
MSKDTFAFSSASLRSFRLEQELQDWEDARRTLAQRRALTRTPLAPVSRPPRQQHSPSNTSRTLGPYRCRDPAVLNTFLSGDMARVYAVLKDPTMVNALMETVQEEMTWAPEMGMWTLTSKVKQTSALRLAASRGHSACVEELLFRGAAVNANPGGRSALHDACAGGHDSCVQLLLSHGADANLLTADGSTALHLCSSAQTFSCARLLVEVGGASADACSSEAKLTPLHVAAHRGLEEHVELLLRHGADVAACNREGETPLNAACAGAERPGEAGRYLRVVQMLLRAGADPRTAGRKRHTPLHNACSNCSSRIVDLLLQHGARADAENCAGYTPMDCLLQVVEDFPDQGPEAVARALLNHGTQPPLPKMLKLCCLSPSTLEVMLDCYVTVPSCDEWIDSVPSELWEEHRPFFESVLRMVGQPRSLQHLCRCSLRRYLGALYQMAISKLDMPAFVRDYLLLRTDGQLR